jgi:hypothetical protein
MTKRIKDSTPDHLVGFQYARESSGYQPQESYASNWWWLAVMAVFGALLAAMIFTPPELFLGLIK